MKVSKDHDKIQNQYFTNKIAQDSYMDPKQGSPERRAMTEMSNENISKKFSI